MMAAEGKLLSRDSSPRRVRSRYDTLAITSDDPEGEEAKEYAAFLREKGRRCGPDGYLDSNKYTHTFEVHGKVLENNVKRPKTTDEEEPPKSGRRSVLGRHRDGAKKTDNVVNLFTEIEKDKKVFDKQIKVIEDHMWKHKQEERELKRSEGDIVKSQHELKRTMRGYELAINRQKQSEDKKLLDSKQKEFIITRDQVHKKESLTKERIENARSKEQQSKDEERKVFLSVGDLERKYSTKMSEIELRRAEVHRLSEEYSQKMKAKEDESYKLNKELAELALSLNMVAQKQCFIKIESKRGAKEESLDKIKTNSELLNNHHQTLSKNAGKANAFENSKRRLSLDLNIVKDHLGEKIRDEGRTLLDTRNHLTDNRMTQKTLQDQACHTKLEFTNKQIEHKLQTTGIRKQKQLQQLTVQRMAQHEQRDHKWEETYAKRQYGVQRRRNEDFVKHAMKTVTKLEEIEHDLSKRVRTSEYARKQKEQSCKRISNQLAELKRKNQQKVKHMMLECLAGERELEQKILREQSELYKSHANREEGYVLLQQHRIKMRKDQHLLNEAVREHQRLLRIGDKTDLMVSLP